MRTTKDEREYLREKYSRPKDHDDDVRRDVLSLLDDADEADALRAVLAEIAEIGCEYGDDCPTFGTRHGQCVPCKARRGCEEEVSRG